MNNKYSEQAAQKPLLEYGNVQEERFADRAEWDFGEHRR
jgi:hypothetical protein